MSHLSPFQFQHAPGESPRLPDFPGLTLQTVQQQGSLTPRDWAKELDVPATYYEEFEALARFRSDRLQGRLTVILMDEASTRLVGTPRLRPHEIALPTICAVELAHEGFLIGTVRAYYLGSIPSWLGVPPPTEIEGTYLAADISFVDSALADKAIEGVKRGLFSHVCPLVWSPPGAPVGTGMLVQVTLTTADYPGCPNARVLSWSER